MDLNENAAIIGADMEWWAQMLYVKLCRTDCLMDWSSLPADRKDIWRGRAIVVLQLMPLYLATKLSEDDAAEWHTHSKKMTEARDGA